MRKDGLATRENILKAAHELIMQYGYGGTTVDEVIQKANLTKGAFFYHFKSKEELAHELLKHYAQLDRTMLDKAIKTAEEKTKDPVEQLFAIVDFYIDMLTIDPHPQGCMYAAYCYESGLMEESTLQPMQEAVLYWRQKTGEKIVAAIMQTPPRKRMPDEVNELADGFLAAFEGGFVLARTLKKPEIIVQQLRLYRHYLSALFQ